MNKQTTETTTAEAQAAIAKRLAPVRIWDNNRLIPAWYGKPRCIPCEPIPVRKPSDPYWWPIEAIRDAC